MENNMNPSDFIFNYKTKEYNNVESFLNENDRLSTVEMQFLLALMGHNTENRIPLGTKDDSKERSLSRVVFNKNAPTVERNIGLITILNNLDLPYQELLNNRAFLKNSNGEKFFSLPNISEFYESLLGGIEPLNDLIFQYGQNKDDIFESLYDYLVDDDNIAVMQNVSEKVKKDSL